MNQSNLRGGQFALIPVSVLHDQRLPPDARLLYGMILSCSSQEGRSGVTNAELAELMGWGRHKTRRMLKELAHTAHIRMEWAEGGSVRTIWTGWEYPGHECGR